MATAAAPPAGARTRILDAALALMSEQGAAGASMRQLAAASGLNVATIYHYFPSKADVLRAVLDERRYGERLSTDGPPLDLSVPPRDRLVGLVGWLWANALEEEAVFRLLVGEALRGEEAATVAAADLVDALAETFEAWLLDWFPELTLDPALAARVLRGQVLALVVEHLALRGVTVRVARQRAEELAAVIFP